MSSLTDKHEDTTTVYVDPDVHDPQAGVDGISYISPYPLLDTVHPVPRPGAGQDPVTPKSNRYPVSPPNALYVETASGTAIESQLGFPCRTIIVDNYTPQYAYIPMARKYVPPYTAGAIYPVTAAGESAKVIWEAPPGITQPASATATKLMVWWREDECDLSSGNLVNGGTGGTSPNASTLNTSQVSVTTGTSIIALNLNRKTVTIFNTAAAGGNSVYVGGTSGVTTTTGAQIPPQTGLTFSNYTGAIFGSATGGAATTVTVAEESA